jgi:hypothetical protein
MYISNFEIQWDRYIVWLSLASRRLYNILYFLWLYNEFFIILYNILKIAELDCCQIIILSIYVPSTHLSNLCSSLDGIWTHTIDTLQNHSLSLTSSVLDHSTTSTPWKRSFNNRSVTFSRKANLQWPISFKIIMVELQRGFI